MEHTKDPGSTKEEEERKGPSGTRPVQKEDSDHQRAVFLLSPAASLTYLNKSFSVAKEKKIPENCIGITWFLL